MQSTTGNGPCYACTGRMGDGRTPDPPTDFHLFETYTIFLRVVMKILGAILIGIFLGPSVASGQTGVITGTVSDAESSEAIPGASIAVSGENMGVATNADGEYTLSDVPAGEHTLTVSFVGYIQALSPVHVESGSTVQTNVQLQRLTSRENGQTDSRSDRTVRVHLTSRTDAATATRAPTFRLVAIGSNQAHTETVQFGLSGVESGTHTYTRAVQVPNLRGSDEQAKTIRLEPEGKIGNYDVIAEIGGNRYRGTVGTDQGAFEFSIPFAPTLPSVRVHPNPASVGEIVWFNAEVQNEETVTWTFAERDTEQGNPAAHTFQSPGTYDVHVAAENTAGEIQKTVPVEVQPAQEDPADAVPEAPDATPPVATVHPPNARTGGLFGASTSRIGDADGDGISDLVVGAPGETVEQTEKAGRTFLLSGADQTVITSYASPNPTPDGQFGASVSVLRAGNNALRLVIGAPGEPANGQEGAGRLYVYRLEGVDPSSLAPSRAGSSEPRPSAESDVERPVPQTQMSRPDAVAVVIGMENYQNEALSDADHAVRDAQAMNAYLTRTLGFQEENVIYEENATGADLDRLFGSGANPTGRLANQVKTGESEVFVYVSGRAGWTDGQAYFIASDTDPDYLEQGGYPVDQLYENLAKLDAESVTAVLDAPVSGEPENLEGARAGELRVTVENPIMTLESGLLLTAGEVRQQRNVHPETQHGLFTHFFLKGLRGAADGDGDRAVSSEEMGTYLEEKVPYWSRRLHNQEQTPTTTGQGTNRVFVEYAERVPARN